MRTKSNLILAAAFLILLSPVFVFAQTTGGSDPAYDEAGFNTNRDTMLLSDFEDIDTFTGGLTLTHTDLKIPGNGGLDLVIQRTFNSKLVCKSWIAQCSGESCYVTCPSSVGSPPPAEDSPIGIGWSMHFGRVKIPDVLGKNPIVEMPDGSSNEAYGKPDGSAYITKDHWLLTFESNTWVLRLTDGRKITFGHVAGAESGYTTSHATQIEDVNGNVIYIYYRSAADPGNLPGTIDYIQMGNSSERRVYFEYQKIAYTYRLVRIRRPDGVYINYSYTQPQYETNVLLTQVSPPIGSPWQYSYNMSTTMHDLIRVVTPSGGIIDYGYDITGFYYGPGSTCFKAFRTLTTRTTSGRIPAGTWELHYFQETNNESTLIKDPCGWWHRHTYYGYNSGLTNGNMWKLGLPKVREIVGYKAINYEWSPSASISNNQYFGNQSCLEFDYVIYVPNLTSKTITKDRTYTTNYSNYDSYGNPGTISESGDQTRTTNISYWYNTSKNIVKNKPQTETITGSLPGSFTTNYTYDSSTGNLTQINKHGVTTNYQYYSNGNLSSEVDANGMTTSYEWSNGKISKISTPAYTINKSINTMGTTASETNGRGNTTAYSYDGNLRLTQITPPIGNSTTYSYASDNTYKSETRGGFSAYYYYDGLGRLTSTQNSLGVVTNIGYRACGIKEYTTSNIGDTVQYDIFGRKSSVTHQDNSHFDFVYSGNNTVGNDFTVGNELGYVDRMFYYNSFGNPDEKLLVQVTDGYSNSANYSYNILGSLTGISQSGVNRGFAYDSRNFLASETHPEKGTISYGRDSIGNITLKTDALGAVSYSYDGVYRLTGINYGTGTIGFSYDGANNRTAMTNPYASISYSYDPSNRQTTKNETILGRNYTTNFSYDGNDNITNINYPSGRSINYSYNSNNQVTSVTGFGGSITNINYCGSGSCIGLPQSYTTSNGLTTNLSYSNRNLTTGIQVGTSALNIGYGYDVKGNTTSIIDNLDSSKKLYLGYDNNNRLVSYSRDDPRRVTGSIEFVYDALGNRIAQMLNVSGEYPSPPYQVPIPSPYTEYNGYGDMTLLQDAVLSYDRLHNLIRYENAGISVADFAYDGDGMRVMKTSGGNTTVYHYDQGGHVTTEDTGNGGFLSDYIYLHGKLVAKIVPDEFVIPIAPSNLTVSVDLSGQVNLTWTDNSNNETGLKIERKTGVSGTYTEIADVGANVTSYSDTNVTQDTVYLYKVKAYNAYGWAYSNEVKISPPNINVSPSTYNFGDVHIGESTNMYFVIINNPYTDMSLVIETISIEGTDADQFIKQSDNCSGHTLARYDNCEIEVAFIPTAVGSKNASLSISSNDLIKPIVNVLLSGTGLPPKLTVLKYGAGGGNIISSPAGINCGSECIEASTMYAPGTVVTLTATPDAYSTFTGWSDAGCAGTNTCTITLNASTSVIANFDLNVPDSDLENGIYINTNGDKLITKIGPTPKTSGVPGDIVHIQFRSNQRTFYCVDCVAGWIYISEINGSYSQKIIELLDTRERKEGDQWVYRYDWDTTGLNPGIYQIHIQSSVFPNGGNLYFSTIFVLGNPLLNGVKLYNDAGYANQTDTFSQGQAVYVEWQSNTQKTAVVSQLRGWENERCNFVDTANTVDQTGATFRYHFAADFIGANITNTDWGTLRLWNDDAGQIEKPIKRKDIILFSPASYNFGSINLGDTFTSPTQVFTVSNTGAAALSINTVLITGADSYEFIKGADTCTGQILDLNANCTIEVAFSPIKIGGKSALLSVTLNDPNKSTLSMALSGTLTSWIWIRQFGSSNGESGNGVAVDSIGNIYVTGWTYGGIDGNPGSDFFDMFLTKYNSSGEKQWTRQLGSSSIKTYQGIGIAVDNSGNVYVTGWTQDAASTSYSEMFLVKYNSSGEKQWIQQLGYFHVHTQGVGVAVDNSGNIYVTGTTNRKLFLVKYNSSGEQQWLQLGPSPIYEGEDIGVAVDNNGNIYVTGTIHSTTNASYSEMFLVKYNLSGEQQWIQQLGITSSTGYGVTVDGNGDIYVTGVGCRRGDLCYCNMFLVKYNSSGTEQWVQWMSRDSYNTKVAVDNNSNVYVNGNYFLAKYNSSGEQQWTQQLLSSSEGSSGINKIAVDSNGYVYLTGSTIVGLGGNTNAGCSDVFLIKVNPAWVKQMPIISVFPASHNFGDIITSSSSIAQTFTVTNAGTEALAINTALITGTNASEFAKSADTCTGQTLNQDANCTIQITFSPTTTGVKSAALTITSNDPNNPTVNIVLSGTGVVPPAPIISISPVSHNFGEVNTGSSATQIFTVNNTGTVSLVVNGVSITGANATEFTKMSDNCTGTPVVPNGNCQIQIAFNPATIGVKNAVLFVLSNDPASPTKDILLNGTGVVPPAPIIAVSPATYNFGDINTGSSSTAQAFTIRNTGNASLIITTLEITGSNASEFNKVSDTCAGQTLNPNSSCTVQVTFTPATAGAKNAVITINSNDPANPILNVTLSGTGIEVPAPTETIIINGGSTSTDERNVTLQVACPYPSGCSRMQFSNNGSTWSNPERFRTTETWRFSGRDGWKTVYVRFRDTAGNWSAPYTATILLDTTNPNTTALPSGGRYNTAQTVTLTCEDGSGSGCDKIYYTTDGSRPTKSSTVYTEPILISQTTTLKYFAIDKVGNREAVNRQRYRIR